MHCASCGAEIADFDAPSCPTCGRALTLVTPTPAQPVEALTDPSETPATATPASTVPAPVAPAPAAPVAPVTPPTPEVAGASETGTAGMAAPAALVGSSTPPAEGGQPPAYPAYPAYPMYAPYGYGQMAQPSVPLAPGQIPPPPYPPSYGPPSQGFAPPSQGFAPYPPGYGPYPQPIPDRPRRRRVGVVVGIVAAALVVCALAAGGLMAVATLLPASSSATFSHASGVTPLATTAPTATATPGENVIFQDDFSSPSSGWANDSHCGYRGDGYHIPDGYICFAPTEAASNVAVTADVKQTSGDVHGFYGIVFRRASHGNFYAFYIDSNGKWMLGKVANDKETDLVPYVPNAAIHTGLDAANTLKVRALGSHFEFFVNDIKVGQFDDTTFTSGLSGVTGPANGELVVTHFTLALLS